MNKRLLQLYAFILLLTSCTENKDGERQLQDSMGQPSEVILVLPNGEHAGALADSLTEVLTSAVPGLNQAEDYFRLSRIPSTMDKAETKKMHSRVVVKIDPSLKAAQMGTAKDVYVRPQTEVLLAAPNADMLLQYLSEKKQDVLDVLLEGQLQNQANYLRQHASKKVSKDLKAMLGCKVSAPEDITFTKKGKDFLWASNRKSEKQLNMVFYRLPYRGEDMYDSKVLCHLRDSVMKENIPGSQPNQWMETVWEADEPVVTASTIYTYSMDDDGEKSTTTMRGLWQMHNGAMGGPFVAQFHFDRKKGEILVCEGFVFSPSTEKRDLIRRLEASLLTFESGR